MLYEPSTWSGLAFSKSSSASSAVTLSPLPVLAIATDDKTEVSAAAYFSTLWPSSSYVAQPRTQHALWALMLR